MAAVFGWALALGFLLGPGPGWKVWLPAKDKWQARTDVIAHTGLAPSMVIFAFYLVFRARRVLLSGYLANAPSML